MREGVVSYQHADTLFTAHATGYALRLAGHEPFVDTGSIGGGELYPQVISQAVADANVVLAMLGPSFAAARLHEPTSVVAFEWRRAQFHGCAVVPVLVAGGVPYRPTSIPRRPWVGSPSATRCRNSARRSRAMSLLDDVFEVLRDWRPTAIALRHPDGRAHDLHPVTLTADGGGDQIQRDGLPRWHYARPVAGRIGGRWVECCSVHTHVDAHLGYEPDDTDRQDMALLGEVFNVTLPPPYDRTVLPFGVAAPDRGMTRTCTARLDAPCHDLPLGSGRGPIAGVGHVDGRWLGSDTRAPSRLVSVRGPGALANRKRGDWRMGFVQIIEFRTSRMDEGRKHVEDWEKATEGKRTARRGFLCQDRNDPDRYLNIVFFDSYEAAMENSNLPETQELAQKLAALTDSSPTFYDLDLVEERF